ncbi:MAG: hypothetical protein JST59_17600 [Actinobacteria bacterium]|nr:hypothetical protein [Actinomycetota bacterium]
MADSPDDVLLTDTEQAILAALCRPIAAGDGKAPLASNQEIAFQASVDVDSVEGHLYTLYRKFGIEDVPWEQQRERLAELAIEGGHVEPVSPPTVRADVPLGSVEARRAAERAAAAARPRQAKRSIGPYVTIAVIVLVIIGASLAVSGIFNQGSTSPPPPSPAAFRAEVAGYCKAAVQAAPDAGGDRAERARAYLAVIEAVRGRLQSVVDPVIPSIDLERFSTGLTAAANVTSDVARNPPTAGSAAEARYVAELNAAAGKIRAGARGYKLGPDCVAVGDIVARSAENAAAPG